MGDKKLASFKAGSLQKQKVSKKPKKGKSEEEQAPAPSVGFARIEAILDKEDPGQVQASLMSLQDALRAFEQESSSARDKAAVKKAIVAIERTADLLNHLFQTKEKLMENAAGAEK